MNKESEPWMKPLDRNTGDALYWRLFTKLPSFLTDHSVFCKNNTVVHSLNVFSSLVMWKHPVDSLARAIQKSAHFITSHSFYSRAYSMFTIVHNYTNIKTLRH